MKKKNGFRLLAFITLVIVSLSARPETRAADYVYMVRSTENSGAGTLRWAINQANTHVDSEDTVTINFDLEETDPNFDDSTDVWTITVDSALPTIIASNTAIDGYSQAGAEVGTSTNFPILVVEIDGSNLVIDPPLYGNSGFNVLSSGNQISGLIINNFPVNGISILGTSATNNAIAGNCIGFGHDCALDEGNDGDGVFIGLGAKYNTIGGDSSQGKNFIAFNGLDGVGIHGSGTSSNTVIGNTIMSNVYHGVYIYGGAHDNTLGGDTPGELNLISANEMDGVRIHGSGTDNNIVAGNFIGTSRDGNTADPNDENGVQIMLGAQENVIGGSTNGTGNLISGNVLVGVLISGTNTVSNTVSGNYIGTNVDTSAEMPNMQGVQISGGAQSNQVGGSSDHERNIISGNDGSGVVLSGSGVSYNLISGNSIGTDASGTEAVGSQFFGIVIVDGASENHIGGDTPGQGNLISGHEANGIFLDGNEISGNLISGNYIGTDITGTGVIGNTFAGIVIFNGPHDNVIGGTSAAERNLISGNGTYGVLIDLDTVGNVVSGNYIGTDINGTTALGNQKTGVRISYSQNNTIGGDEPGAGNLISGNIDSGVMIYGEEATGNVVLGNYIGTDKDGAAAIPNASGVSLTSGVSDNVVGGDSPGESNLISGNTGSGMVISGTNVLSNTIMGNYIGTDSTGELALGNHEYGVYISGGPQNNRIGLGNLIAHNTLDGVLVSGIHTTGNNVSENSIYANRQGISLQFGGNSFIEPPEISSATSDGLVVGRACAGCIVELFWNEFPDGEGEVYLGTANAGPDGAFALSVSLPSVHNLTATDSDSRGTSEFSNVHNPVYLAYLPIMVNGE